MHYFSLPRWLRILCLFLSVGCVHAQTDKVDTLTRIQMRYALQVCIWPDYFGISYRDAKTRELRGIDVDLAKALADDLQVPLTFVDSSFARLIEDVTTSRCDIAMFAIGITPERQKHLRFTSPHLASDIYGITSKSNRRIKSWDDIDKSGTVVVVAKGTLHETVMRERLRFATLEVVDTPQAREQEVESGRADVFMTDYPFSERMLHTVSWARRVAPSGVYQITPYAWAMRPGDDRWYARVQQFLTQVRRDGRLRDLAARHGLSPIVLLD